MLNELNDLKSIFINLISEFIIKNHDQKEIDFNIDKLKNCFSSFNPIYNSSEIDTLDFYSSIANPSRVEEFLALILNPSLITENATTFQAKFEELSKAIYDEVNEKRQKRNISALSDIAIIEEYIKDTIRDIEVCLKDIFTQKEKIALSIFINKLNEFKKEISSAEKVRSRESDKCIQCEIITKPPSRNSFYIERNNESLEINNYISSQKSFISIHSIGGLGKSHFAKNIFWNAEKTKSFAKLCWINYQESLDNSINEAISLFCTNNDLESAVNDFKAKLITDRNSTLIIIDNFDEFSVEDLKFLNSLPSHIKVIVTTRVLIEDALTIELSDLSLDECKALFNHYADTNYDSEVEQLIDLFNYHTLTIELAAKTCKNSNINLEELYSIFKDNGIDTSNIISDKVDHYSKSDLMVNHIRRLFTLSKVSSIEKRILRNISLIANQSIKLDLLKEICELDNNNEINTLVLKGWIYRDKIGNIKFLRIHPIIQQVVKIESEINVYSCVDIIRIITGKMNLLRVEDNFCRDLLSHSVNLLKNFKNNRYLKDLYLEVAFYSNYFFEYQQALKYARYVEEISDEDDLDNSVVINLLAVVYRSIHDVDNSIKYALLDLDIAKKNGLDSEELSKVYSNAVLALSSSTLAKDLELAIQLAKADLDLCNGDIRQSEKIKSLANAGLLYYRNGNLVEAEKNYDNAIMLLESDSLLREDVHYSSIYEAISVVKFELGKKEVSRNYAIKCYELRVSSNSIPFEYIERILTLIIKLSRELSLFREEYEYLLILRTYYKQLNIKTDLQNMINMYFDIFTNTIQYSDELTKQEVLSLFGFMDEILEDRSYQKFEKEYVDLLVKNYETILLWLRELFENKNKLTLLIEILDIDEAN